MYRVLFLLFVPVLLSPLARSQHAKLDLDKTFKAGNSLLEQKMYAQALVEYQKILVVEPELEGPLRNGAMAAFFAGDYKTSVEYYKKLKASDPGDGFVRSKLVEDYQAMGDEKARDAERVDLIAMHNAGKDTSDLAKRPNFCRDIYSLGSRHIFVYEPFVFKPRSGALFAVRYQFIVDDSSGKQEMRIEAGWDRAQKNATGAYQPDPVANSFYFDAYYPAGQYARRTMGLFTAEPTYTDAKAHVQAIIEGKIKSSGGTGR